MTTIDLEACLDLVAERRRRRLIEQLRTNGTGQTTIEELVDRLHRGELAPRTERPPNRENLAILLYHTDLPKLDAFGIVDFDFDRRTVRYRPNEQLEAVLDSLPEEVPEPDP